MELRHTGRSHSPARLQGHVVASVVVGAGDFPRLRLGAYEPAAGLSPCIAWCHATLGGAYERWEFEAADDADIFHFARLDDAVRFLGLFAEERAPVISDIRVAA